MMLLGRNFVTQAQSFYSPTTCKSFVALAQSSCSGFCHASTASHHPPPPPPSFSPLLFPPSPCLLPVLSPARAYRAWSMRHRHALCLASPSLMSRESITWRARPTVACRVEFLLHFVQHRLHVMNSKHQYQTRFWCCVLNVLTYMCTFVSFVVVWLCVFCVHTCVFMWSFSLA